MSVTQAERDGYHAHWFGLASSAVSAAAEPAKAAPWLSKPAVAAAKWVGPTSNPSHTHTCGAMAALALDYAKCTTVAERQARAPVLTIYARLVSTILVAEPARPQLTQPRRRLDLDGPADE